MYKSKFTLSLTILIAFFILVGCKNELQVNAKYDPQPVIYGVLNPYDSVQVFRIIKSFSGDGSPSEYAKVPDSSYFRDVDLRLTQVLEDVEQNSWPLIKTIRNDKKEGVFFAPEQVVYAVTTSKESGSQFYINPEAKFVLEGDVDGKNIKSEFGIIKENKDFPFFLSSANKFNRFWRGSVSLVNGTSINDITFELLYPEGTKVAGFKIIFTYHDIYAGATEGVEQKVVFNLGEQIVDNAQNQKEIKFAFSGERFYERIGTELADIKDVPNLLYRKSGAVEFEMLAVTEDLFYYSQVKNTSEGIAQDRQEYTNIENGYGVLAGRQVVTMNEQMIAHGIRPIEVLLNKASEKELVTGLLLGYTGGKGFCADPSHKLGDISCE